MSRSQSPAYYATAAVSGLLFGAGLYVSQMVDPLKVLHFLDFGAIASGGWDPSLALVMASAVVVMFAAVRLSERKPAPLFDDSYHKPLPAKVDAPLIAGAAIFGVGWGMSGICPGPAISLAAFWPPHLMVYLAALFIGSYASALLMPAVGGNWAAAVR